jgi:hypothetical protein
MILLRLLPVVLMITVLFTGISPVLANSIDPADVGPFVDAFILAQMEKNQIPNAAVAVVSNGEVIYLNGYGFADIDRQIPVDPNQTLFPHRFDRKTVHLDRDHAVGRTGPARFEYRHQPVSGL